VVDPSIGRAHSPTLLVVGAAARDQDSRDPRGWRLGGTVNYAAIAAAHLGLHVRALIGLDEAASAATELGLLTEAGVDVRHVGLTRGPVFDNRQTPAGRVQHAIQPSDQMAADSLPDEWRGSDGILLAPVAGELGANWASARTFPSAAVVALAWQGLVRELAPGQPVRQLPLTGNPLVGRSDMLLVSAEDIAAGGQPLLELLRDGQELVVTNGRKGGIYLRRTKGGLIGRMVPAVPAEKVLDTTGAGDVFLAAWLAGRLLLPRTSAEQEWRPLTLAAVMAGLSVGSSGLAGIPTGPDVCRALVTLRDQRRH
jgi:sugar/nucleoside kinase (ribokinase family)